MVLTLSQPEKGSVVFSYIKKCGKIPKTYYVGTDIDIVNEYANGVKDNIIDNSDEMGCDIIHNGLVTDTYKEGYPSAMVVEYDKKFTFYMAISFMSDEISFLINITAVKTTYINLEVHQRLVQEIQLLFLFQ